MKNEQLTANKKSPVFSLGIFLESMRRLRVMTVLFTVFLTFSSLVTPIVSVIEQTSTPGFSFAKLSATPIDAFSHHATFLILFVIAAPMVTLTLFSFLTVRRDSDFYHALPYTRTCLYVSLVCAAAASLLFIIFVPTLLSALVYTLLSRFFYLSLAKLFLFAFGCFVGALSVAAACTLGISLTGTRFSAVAVTGMILFLPRFIISMMTATLEAALPMVTAGHVAPFFDNSASYVYGFVSYVFPFFSVPTVSPVSHAYNFAAMLYTLCLTAVYGALALLAFKKRPSETAEKPAPNRRLQTVFRCAVGLFCSLFVCSTLFLAIVEGMPGDTLTAIIVSYLFVFIAYCLYELMTTRRPKAMVRAMPSFSIVLLLNAALLLTMGGIYHSRLSFTPTKDEIKSVSIAADAYTESSSELTFYEYLTIKTSSVALSDEESRAAVAAALSDCVETYRTLENVYDYDRHYEEHRESEEGYTSLDLVIRTKSGKHYRTVYMPKADAAALYTKFSESDTYQKVLTALPKPMKNTLGLYASGNAVSFRGNVADETFALFSEELKNLSAEERAAWWQTSEESDCYFLYSIELGVRNVTLFIDVPPSLFPRTHARFLELAADKQLADGTVTAVKNALAHKDAAEYYELSFSVRSNGKQYFANLYQISDIDTAREAFSLIDFHTPTEDEAAVTVTAYFWDESVIDEKLAYQGLYLVGGVTNDNLDAFLELLGMKKTSTPK